MPTKNIVPRTGSEGEIGTSAKPWKTAHINEVTASIGVSGTFLYGDGTSIINVPADTLNEVVNAGDTTTNTINVGNLTSSAGVVAVGVHSTDVTASAGMVASYFVGALKGNADTATSATSATNADTVDTKHATDFTLDYVTSNGSTTTNDITTGDISFGAATATINDSSANTRFRITSTATAVKDQTGFTHITAESSSLSGKQTTISPNGGSSAKIIVDENKVNIPNAYLSVANMTASAGVVAVGVHSTDVTASAGIVAVGVHSTDVTASAGVVAVGVHSTDVTASAGVVANYFIGDGSGLTGVTGDWDGQHTGAAAITGSLTIQDSDGLTIKATAGAPTIGTFANPGDTSLTITANQYLNINSTNGLTTTTSGDNKNASRVFEIEGNNIAYDDIQLYLKPSTYSTHQRYLGIGYNNSTNTSVISAGKAGTGDNELAIWTSNSSSAEAERVRIDVSGNVGIGTTTPAQKLDVVGNVAVAGALSASSNIAATKITASVYLDNFLSTISFENTGTLIWAKNTGQDLYLEGGRDVYIRPDRDVKIYTGTGAGTNWVNFDGDDQKVEVVGDISASLGITASSFVGDGSGLTNVTEADTLATVTARGASTTTPVLFNTHITASSGINSGPLHVQGSSVHSGSFDIYNAGLTIFGTDGTVSGSISSAGQISASLGITASSFVGDGSGLTGVTGDWDGQHTGAAGITGSLTIQDSDGLTIKATAGSPTIGTFANPGDTSLTITANQYLNINSTNGLTTTTSGDNKNTSRVFEIEGNNIAYDDIQLYLKPSTYSTHQRYLGIGYNNSTNTSVISAGKIGTGDSELAIWTSNSSSAEAERMRIDVSGNVGIGTTTPAHKLDVVGDISASLGITAGSVTTDNVVSSGGFTIGSAVITEGEFERLDGASSTVAANKVVIADGSKNVATLGTVGCGAITSTGASSLESVDVSGSTALGNLVTDTHIITGSTEVYVEAQTGLQVLQNVASSGYPVARFENTNAGGSTYIETHGTNQGGLKMYRGGVLRATIDTAGNAFTMYAGTPVPANLGFMIQSGKAEFKETTGDNFTGTKAQLNISASSGPAIRIDSGATGNETTFKVEDYTTTIVSGSADLLTMDDTTAPPTPSNAAHMYAKSGEMFVMDTGGNETQISPHDEEGEWQYFSRNTITGKVVRIKMEKMIRKLEELTGETFIEEE